MAPSTEPSTDGGQVYQLCSVSGKLRYVRPRGRNCTDTPDQAHIWFISLLIRQENVENSLKVKNSLKFYFIVGACNNCWLFPQDAEKWLTALQKQMRDQAQTLMPIDEVQERVREAVHAHFYTLANLFKEIDYANIGVISKEDFRDVMDKNVMRFTDEQVC